jgi:hypothetical protein
VNNAAVQGANGKAKFAWEAEAKDDGELDAMDGVTWSPNDAKPSMNFQMDGSVSDKLVAVKKRIQQILDHSVAAVADTDDNRGAGMKNVITLPLYMHVSYHDAAYETMLTKLKLKKYLHRGHQVFDTLKAGQHTRMVCGDLTDTEVPAAAYLMMTALDKFERDANYYEFMTKDNAEAVHAGIMMGDVNCERYDVLIVLITRDFWKNENMVNIALNSTRPKVLINTDLGFVDIPRQYNYYVEKFGILPLDVGSHWNHMRYEIEGISRKIAETIAHFGSDVELDHFQAPATQQSIGL